MKSNTTIQIDELFRLSIDSFNFELIREEKFDSEDQEGNPIISTRSDTWYYPKLQLALNRYLTESVRPSKNIEEILKNIKNVQQTIENLSKKI